jgi:hypothetical protein
MTDYYQKYIKYKAKYLNLKNLELSGGFVNAGRTYQQDGGTFEDDISAILDEPAAVPRVATRPVATRPVAPVATPPTAPPAAAVPQVATRPVAPVATPPAAPHGAPQPYGAPPPGVLHPPGAESLSDLVTSLVGTSGAAASGTASSGTASSGTASSGTAASVRSSNDYYSGPNKVYYIFSDSARDVVPVGSDAENKMIEQLHEVAMGGGFTVEPWNPTVYDGVADNSIQPVAKFAIIFDQFPISGRAQANARPGKVFPKTKIEWGDKKLAVSIGTMKGGISLTEITHKRFNKRLYWCFVHKNSLELEPGGVSKLEEATRGWIDGISFPAVLKDQIFHTSVSNLPEKVREIAEIGVRSQSYWH